jgi:hypothetical protein
MTQTLELPAPLGQVRPYKILARPLEVPRSGGFRSRIAYAAAHVVADHHRTDDSGNRSVDWEGTMAFRRYLWSLGFKVAEAMDTSQRGMGVPAQTSSIQPAQGRSRM